MARMTAGLPAGQSLPDGLFDSRHRAMTLVLAAHVLILPLVAIAYGAPAQHALMEGAIIGAFTLAAVLARGQARRTRALIGATGLLTCSAVLVHITGGLIEAHFHFFVVVTALSLYEDWAIFGLAIGYVLLHHGVGSVTFGEDVFAHEGNAWQWALVHALFISGLCVANVAVWRASERVRDDLTRSNQELEQFAYVTSHDLSEPLQMISNQLRLLERRYGAHFGDDGRQLIEHSVEGATRMRTLIDELLAYSRVGRTGARHEPVDTAAAVDATLRGLAATVEASQAEIEVGEMPVVEGDRVQIERLLQNLISNAIKFRDDDPPHVAVKAERRGSEWVFTVADNGIGLAPEDAERAFEMFGRLHAGDDYDGHGIGLATCRRIVEQHGGRIWVESAPAQGARFRFTIPAS